MIAFVMPTRLKGVLFGPLITSVWVFALDQVCGSNKGGGLLGECSHYESRPRLYSFSFTWAGLARSSSAHARFVLNFIYPHIYLMEMQSVWCFSAGQWACWKANLKKPSIGCTCPYAYKKLRHPYTHPNHQFCTCTASFEISVVSMVRRNRPAVKKRDKPWTNPPVEQTVSGALTISYEVAKSVWCSVTWSKGMERSHSAAYHQLVQKGYERLAIIVSTVPHHQQNSHL